MRIGASFKQSNKSQKTSKKTILTTAAMAVAVFMAITPLVAASTYQQQINELNNQNARSSEAQKTLEMGEATLSEKVTNLQNSISSLQGQINENNLKSQRLAEQVAQSEVEIADQRQTLGQNIKRMYVEGEMSTLEEVASSKSMSEYVDKEQYRISVQHKVKRTLERIKQLKQEQEEQKTLIEKIVVDQQVMQNQIAAEKAESDRLLALNRSEQQQFDQQIAANKSKISDLQRRQAEETARMLREQQEAARRIAAANNSSAAPASVPRPANVGGVNGHNYPYANAPFPNSMVDPWGMYKRQCVSYTAWAVAASGRHMPYWGGRGNAHQWDDNARAAGIPVDGNPRVGDVAVSHIGYYGHVMYVDAVHGDGTITISQYNAAWDGRFSTARITTGGLVFIHFR